jgi:hypothetical protein
VTASVISIEAVTADSGTITIPATCTAVYFFWSYFNSTSGQGLASATVNSASPDQTGEVATAGGNLSAAGVAAWYSPSTGSQAYSFSFDAARTEGPTRVFVYVKDGDTTAWRDQDAAANSSTNAVSVTLTTQSGDLVLMADQHFSDTAPGTPPSFTSAGVQEAQNGESVKVSYITASGSTQACDAQNENYTTVVAISIPAGASVTYTMESWRFRNDDGSETAATWKAAENTDATFDDGANFRIRFVIDRDG